MYFLGASVSDPVTINLVIICFSVTVVALGVFSYFTQRFQTKMDSDKAEADMRAWIGRIETEVATMQTSLEGIGRDVSYIRGRLEPKELS